MPCYFPLWAIPRSHRVEKLDNGSYAGWRKGKYYGQWKILGALEALSFEEVKSRYSYMHGPQFVEPVQVPCGKCVGCRLEYSRQWANRIVVESMQYPKNSCWFLTLTYDDNSNIAHNLSKTSSNDICYTLTPKDLTLFLKRLRERFRASGHTGVRFYACGEYGSSSARPHFHICVFNLPIPDLKYYSKNHNGDALYNSDLINEIWSYGHVVIGELTWQSAAYVARYVMKKRKGSDAKDYYEQSGLFPEFVRMSRRPGIGLQYFDENWRKLYEFDEMYLPNGKTCKPVRYFDKKLKLSSPLLYEKIKFYRRKCAEIVHDDLFSRVGYSEREYLKNQERSQENRQKLLTRGVI